MLWIVSFSPVGGGESHSILKTESGGIGFREVEQCPKANSKAFGPKSLTYETVIS